MIIGPAGSEAALFATARQLDTALNAYRRMIYEDVRRPRGEQLSFVLHLGDFIYEVVKYPEDGQDGMDRGRKLTGAVRYPKGEKVARSYHVPVDLDDYRTAYKSYLLDPELRREHRARGQALLRRLAPVLGAPLRPGAVHAPGSPLATVGGCLLAPRVVADLSCFASQPVGRRGTSQRRPAALTVTLLLPSPDHAEMLCVEGELVPMTDPQPKVLAVALSSRALARLEQALPARCA